MKKELIKLVAKLAYREAEKNANSASVFLHGQPEIPEQVKRLNKSEEKNY